MSEISGLGTEVAIIGMSGRFPGAGSLDEFWRNLASGAESISFFSEEELAPFGIDRAALNDPNYVKAKPALDGIDLFDASFFGCSPKEAELMDPQHRLFLECAWAALENAGYDVERFAGPVGVYAGAGVNTYLLFNLYADRGLRASLSDLQAVLLHGNDKDYLATRVSYKLNLKGPSLAVQTACSTSLVAVHLACQSLLSGECDMALAGGISISVPQKTGYFYQEGGILSPDGHCRAFNAQAQGTVFGDGVGVVVLKRLADALADGDCIHAIIRGSAINNDGSLKAGFTAPSVDGQAGVIMDALAMARVDPATITYVEAHGTGTDLGDPIEIEALTQAFRTGTSKTGFCAIGSVKTNVGHLDRAAGIAGLLKTVLALKHKQIPPSLHFQQPNPKIDFAHSPFYVNTTLADWKATTTPRRAGVSAFGIGGTNAHIVLEEAPIVEPSGDSRPWQVLPLSAKTASALDAATTNLAAHLRQHPDLHLADVAYTLQAGRRAFNHRRAVICQNTDDAATALETLDADRVLTSVAATTSPSVAFMFPGQGAQHVQMAADLYRHEPLFRTEMDRCCALLEPHLKLDLRAMIYPAESEIEAATDQINQTALAQPALFAIEYALARLWQAWGVRPQAMIGHSIGEYVAACLAGVFSLEDALMLVAARGRLMQGLPGGAMLAVSLPEEQAFALLGGYLDLAAVNGPSHCVVSGPPLGVEALHRQLVAQNVDCHRLHTSHAFHSAMMDPILEPFAQQVAGIDLKPPRLPFISNLTGDWITDAEATSPMYWVKHLRQTVRFSEGVRRLLQGTDRVLLEVGPGRTLSTLVQYQSEEATGSLALSSLPRPRDERSDVASLLDALGQLWLAGAPVAWFGFAAHERRHRLPLPSYPFERKRYWVTPRRSEPDADAHENRWGDQTLGVHPLISHMHTVASVPQFESQLGPQALPYLLDHRLGDVAALPFTAYVEMALSVAAMASANKPYALANLASEKTLFLFENETCALHVFSVPGAARELEVVIAQAERAEWTRYATARICRGEIEQSARVWESPQAIRERCAEEISADEFYRTPDEGLQLGPAFRGIERIWRREDEALGFIRLPEAIAAEAAQYHIHPAFLDAGLQVLTAILPALQASPQAFVPVSCRSAVMHERPGAYVWSHALLGSDGAEGDIRLLDENGQIVMAILGCRFQPIDRDAVASKLSRATAPLESPDERIAVHTEAEIERIIADAWRRVLGIDSIGPHDKFFELGGNSLLGLQVISHLNKTFKIRIPPVSLYEGATISSLTRLVAAIQQESQNERPHLDRRRDRGEKRREEMRRRKALAAKHSEGELDERIGKD